jgi:molybdenum cofactor guanylyltransferase
LLIFFVRIVDSNDTILVKALWLKRVKPISNISAIILAGGKSTRLGKQKALEIVNNKLLINRVLQIVGNIAEDIIIVTSSENYSSFEFLNNLQIVVDTYPGSAALGAIYTGLRNISNEYGLVVACDMPFLNVNLLKYIVDLSADYEIVVPKINDLLEPLHGIYKKVCTAYIESLLGENELLIRKLYKMARTRFISDNEINRYDPNHLSLFNINTGEDLIYANKLARTYNL